MKNKLTHLLGIVPLVAQTLIPTKINAQELHPEVAINLMYIAAANLHGQQAVPRVYRPIPGGFVTSCGVMPEVNAIYCPADHSIYISIEMVRRAYSFGDAALAYLIGHEYAHAMQNAYRFRSGNTPIDELQADCLAGVYMAATPDIHFDERDILEVAAFAKSGGDFNIWSQQHHGTPQQRVAAVVHGLGAANFSACF